jgi:hypothetical protein
MLAPRALPAGRLDAQNDALISGQALSAIDGPTFAAMPGVMLGMALLAAYVPARRDRMKARSRH